MRLPALLAALALVLVLAGCGSGDDDGDTTATPPPPAATGTSGGECRDVAQPGPKAVGTQQPPTEMLSEGETYRVEVETSCGTFTITLDQKASPKAAASFASLARNGYFDGTFFHRIVPGFVIQGGDPTGSGTGGPGYSTVDTPAPGTQYTKNVVAMAKTGAEAPGTAGSQFFIVTAPDAGLMPDYAVVGHVTGGEDVVARIAVLGDPNTEAPTQPVVIEKMTVED
jgi:cyclophilin family peptidyl-prolyl cis-trans isomerase